MSAQLNHTIVWCKDKAKSATCLAELLGLSGEGYGRLEVGGPAHVTVLTETAEVVLPDASGNQITAPRLEPTTVLHHGELVETTPWRGAFSA